MVTVLEVFCIVVFFFLLLYEFYQSIFRPPDPPQTLPSIQTNSAFEGEHIHMIHTTITTPQKAITCTSSHAPHNQQILLSPLPDIKQLQNDRGYECACKNIDEAGDRGMFAKDRIRGASWDWDKDRFSPVVGGIRRSAFAFHPSLQFEHPYHPKKRLVALGKPISEQPVVYTTKGQHASVVATPACFFSPDGKARESRRVDVHITSVGSGGFVEAGAGYEATESRNNIDGNSPSGYSTIPNKTARASDQSSNSCQDLVMTQASRQSELANNNDDSDDETTYTYNSSSTIQQETDTIATSIGSFAGDDEYGFLDLNGNVDDCDTKEEERLPEGDNEIISEEECLLAMIAELPSPNGASLIELVRTSRNRLSKPRCCAITLLGCGRANMVFLLKYIDYSDLAASITLCSPGKFNASAKRSEIATMYFVRESGLYPSVPVPKVYAWDLTYTNAVGAPYVLMEAIRGRQISDSIKTVDGCVLTGLDALNTDEQMAVTQSLANLHADLKVPLHQFDGIGSITRAKAAEGEFTIGPLYTSGGRTLGGPFKSLHDYWITVVKDQMKLAMDEWHARKIEDLARRVDEPQGTPRDFSACLHFLSVLIPWFIPPASQQYLVLSHPDLALRNIIFDSNDLGKIVGVLDWAGASVIPLVLSGAYPSDLFTREDDLPFPLSPSSLESLEGPWTGVPFDWASQEPMEKASWPNTVSPIGSAVVRRCYLRQHFASYYAIKSDHDITRASLFHDAPYYLKFHELLSGGWRSWLLHRDWISDTYWRIKWKVAGYDGTPIIVGPNVYKRPVDREPLILDLGQVDTSTDRFSPYTKL